MYDIACVRCAVQGVCVCVCVCACVRTRARVYTYMQELIATKGSKCIHVCECLYVCERMSAYTCICMQSKTSLI